MRNQRNFRRQSGRQSNGQQMDERATTKIHCFCEGQQVDDLTGVATVSWSTCMGTVSNGVVDCSCCSRHAGKSASSTASGGFLSRFF
jgi:hypothetical protein